MQELLMVYIDLSKFRDFGSKVDIIMPLFPLFKSTYVSRRTIAKQYTHEELMLMKTQDIGYVLSKAQSECKVKEKKSERFLCRPLECLKMMFSIFLHHIESRATAGNLTFN
jgi:hypothetical protein